MTGFRKVIRRILEAHSDVLGMLLGAINETRPNDGRLNYTRALIIANAIDILCAFNIVLSCVNMFHVKGLLPTRYLVMGAVVVTGLNLLLESVVGTRFHLSDKELARAPEVARLTKWLVGGYAAIQIPWLVVNKAWHVMQRGG